MVYSVSSRVMTKLIQFRNPKYLQNNSGIIQRRVKNITKRIIAEPCFLFISLAALVESIVSILFLCLSIPFYLISLEKPYLTACKWLKSASFTYTWGSVLIVYNFTKTTLISSEPNAFNY